MIEDNDRNKVIEDTLHSGMTKRALNHKKAIQAEMQRREDLKNEKRMQEEEAAREGREGGLSVRFSPSFKD